MTDYLKMKGDSRWFTHDRFGMFIHWGLYSMPARHEWIRHFEKITNEDYQIYFDLFNPDLFNPKEWAKAAREAGMRYVVFTTKHHEGFCMWDTKYTDYKITNTPYGKDALREIVDAFRAEGIHIGLYYSLIDWHHPDFTVDWLHPLRERPDRDVFNANRDMNRYRQYMKDQITELLTNYGKIDVMWFDFSYPIGNKGIPDTWSKDHPERRSWDGKDKNDWDSEGIVKLVRSLQPNILIDNRLNLPECADIVTPEQNTPDEDVTAGKTGVVWEGCQTFSGSWGYFRDEMSWKSGKQCVDMLINHVARNGNIIMNVGPTSRGYLDYRAMECLKAYADWMKYNNRAIYGCGAAPKEFPEPRDCRYTYNAETNRLYLHLMNWPFKHVLLKGLAGKLRYAQFLHDGSQVLFRDSTTKNVDDVLNAACPEGAVALELPVIQPPVCTPVIELILK
jgi:alpha-L-fucosidase